VNQRAKYLGQKSFRSKVILRIHTDRHTHTGATALPGPLNRSVINRRGVYECQATISRANLTGEQISQRDAQCIKADVCCPGRLVVA